MKPYDPDDAVELANRLQEVIRALPTDTHPHTIMTALCAMLARGISLLEPQERERALTWAMETVRIGVEPIN
ncbi:MAG: hypothetical protein A4S17_02630 [Proteobacteria bacterium HN_bin10]|nr:MAG: hypothetical protein A4S17_02630 [Proteobacteria bacterium HN_bin10]